MTDIKKPIVEVIQDLLDSERWTPALDQRSAAEVMSALFYEDGANLNAGPAASQVFDAAVLWEQVDPT